LARTNPRFGEKSVASETLDWWNTVKELASKKEKEVTPAPVALGRVLRNRANDLGPRPPHLPRHQRVPTHYIEANMGALHRKLPESGRERDPIRFRAVEVVGERHHAHGL